MESFSNPKDAAEWVISGKILLHPTEGVWGLGCLYDSKKAINRISELKQRSEAKNYILLMPNLAWVQKLGSNLGPIDLEDLKTFWPGHCTILFEPSIECPRHLISALDRVAMRVSAHKPIKDLLNVIQKPIVSTSANISGEVHMDDMDFNKKLFNFDDVAIYNKPLGGEDKPSKIIDFLSREIVRE